MKGLVVNMENQGMAVSAIGSGPQKRLREGGSLSQLRLTPEDIETLKRQGAVQPERRGPRCVYKLRFRRGRQQVVRYIGDAEEAARVREELAALQARHRKARELSGVAKAARRVLRESKQVLEPHLAGAGYAFHGLAIRKTRKRLAN